MTAITALSVAAPAGADAPARPRSGLIGELARCLSIGDAASRLACSDAAARRLVEAERDGTVTLVDREEASAAQRARFGKPAVAVISRPTRDTPPAGVDRLDGVIRTASTGAGDRWLLTLADGGRWQTTEPWAGGDTPRSGATVTIRRGAIGSYVLKMAGARAVRVRRVD